VEGLWRADCKPNRGGGERASRGNCTSKHGGGEAKPSLVAGIAHVAKERCDITYFCLRERERHDLHGRIAESTLNGFGRQVQSVRLVQGPQPLCSSNVGVAGTYVELSESSSPLVPWLHRMNT